MLYISRELQFILQMLFEEEENNNNNNNNNKTPTN